MTITRVGSNDAYASGWETAFGGKKRKATIAPASQKSADKSQSAGKGKKTMASVERPIEGKQPVAKKAKSATAKSAPKKSASKKAPTKKQATKKAVAKSRA